MKIRNTAFLALAAGFLHLGLGVAVGCPFCEEGGGMYYERNNMDYSVADVIAPKMAAATLAPPVAPASVTSPLPSAPPAFPEVKKGTDGFWRVGFEHLASFAFTPPDDATPLKPGSVEMIPAKVQALDGKRVCVSGYMLPLKMENGFVREFLLIRNPMMCCYGVVPAMNEWVVVKMKGQPTVTMMDVPLNFYGTLHVGAIYENKVFEGLYELDGEKVSVN